MTLQPPPSEIDFDHLNRYVGGDAALTEEVFGMFVHQVEMWGRMLTPDADDDTWGSVTHSLKGSAKAVGAIRLAQLCEDAETLVSDDNRPGGRERAVQNIEHCVFQVKSEIQRWQYRQKLSNMRSALPEAKP